MGSELPPICPTAQRQLQAQHSRKPEQLWPSLPEGPHLHCEHSQHFLGCLCWTISLDCSRSVTQSQTPCVCSCGDGRVLGTEQQLSTQQALRNLREPLWAWLPHPVGCSQHRNRPGISHPIPCGEGWITDIPSSWDH